jgi:hypothetical protein
MRDIIAVQVTTLGVIHGLAQNDHPVTGLDWATAKDDFYSVVDDGLDAELHWITAGGEQTTDKENLFADVFRAARNGLADRGLSEDAIDRYVSPIEARWEHRTSPSMWKKARVREGLEDGASLEEAIHGMQRAYIRKTRETDCFTAWL